MTGFDSSTKMVDLARQRLGADAALHVADVGSPLPFPDGAFDDVIASLVLQTAPLTELRRVLKPGGRLIMSVHNSIIFKLIDPKADYFATSKWSDEVLLIMVLVGILEVACLGLRRGAMVTVVIDGSEENFLLWLLENDATPTGRRASVFIPFGDPPPRREIMRDAYLARLVSTDLLVRLVNEGIVKVYDVNRPGPRGALEEGLALFLPEVLSRHSPESLASIYEKMENPKSYERFVSLTECGLSTAKRAADMEGALRRLEGRSRRARVRAAVLCWIYDDPLRMGCNSARCMITTTVRPRLNGALITMAECDQAEDALLKQGLVAYGNPLVYAARVYATPLGIECAERYEGDWVEMQEEKKVRLPPSVAIGIMGNVTAGQGVVVQSENVEQKTRDFTAIDVSEDAVELARRIYQLACTNADQIAKSELVQRDALDLVKELGRPEGEQDEDRIKDALDRIGSRGSAVASIVEAVRRLWDAVSGTLT